MRVWIALILFTLACGTAGMHRPVISVEASTMSFNEAEVRFYCSNQWIKTLRQINTLGWTKGTIPDCPHLSFRVRFFATNQASEMFYVQELLEPTDILRIYIGHRLYDVTWYVIAAPLPHDSL